MPQAAPVMMPLLFLFMLLLVIYLFTFIYFQVSNKTNNHMVTKFIHTMNWMW